MRALLLATLGALASALACVGADGRAARQAVPGGDADRGRRLAASYGCGGCHVLPDVPGARGRVGPPLERFADRHYIAGRVPNEPAALVRWIMDPQALDPETVMPDLGVTAEHAVHIAAYLYAHQAGPLGPPHLLPERILPAH